MLVDSKQQKLQMQDVIKNAVEETKSEYDPKTAFLAIVKETTLPNTQVLQIGNTLFIVHDTEEKGHGIFRAINADTAQNYLDNSVEFTQKAYNELNYDFLTTEFTDPTLLNIFKYVGKDKPNGMGYMAQKSKDGKTYRVTITLGKRRA
jgi:hypothetical protein